MDVTPPPPPAPEPTPATPTPAAPRVGLWRLGAGLYTVTGSLLAVALVVLLNLLAARMPLRIDLNRPDLHGLSDRTRALLGSINAEIAIDIVYPPRHRSFEDLRRLLRQYEHAARHTPSTLAFRIRFVDPDRDLATMKELRGRHGIEERAVLVCRNANRVRVVRDADLYEEIPLLRSRIAFHGEEALSAALLDVTQPDLPVVYAVTGHGERDLEGYDAEEGYAHLARLIRREGVELRPLALPETQRVPDDCRALLLAGPTRRYAETEVDRIREYMDLRGGRMLLLVDPFVTTGLEPLLERYGVQLAPDYVVDSVSFNGGRDFFAASFSTHPITRRLRNLAVQFTMPRSVERTTPAAASLEKTDKPRVTILAHSSPNGWAEQDLGAQRVAFDPALDRAGPVGLAAAVERGLPPGVRVHIEPTRLVVIGDSDIASNRMLRDGAGGNIDFFLGCLNWLLDRAQLVGAGPRPVDVFRVDGPPHERRAMVLALVVGLPAVAILLGGLIWLARRR